MQAGAALEIDVEVEEGKALPLRFAADVLVAELFILRLDDGQVLLFDLKVGNVRDDWLDGERPEALIGEEEHVLGEIQVLRRERAAHIVVLVAADLDELLDLVDDRVKTALSEIVLRTASCTSFLPSRESTTFSISRLRKSMASSLSKSPLVVVVNRKRLPRFAASSLA